MAGWRDIKTKASAVVHGTFECPAVYLPALIPSLATRVDVRVHTKVGPTENEFIWPGASPLVELSPRLVFRKDQLAMTRQNAVVVLSATEMYRMGASEPDRFGYYKVDCVRLDQSECVAVIASLGTVTGPVWDGVLL